MKSVIQDKKECIICGSWNVEDHHVFFGPNRKASEKYGLKVWLCPTHHRGTAGVHGRDGHELDIELKQLGQKAFEWKYDRDIFIEIFGRNYL
jgi:hypothetical protein